MPALMANKSTAPAERILIAAPPKKPKAVHAETMAILKENMTVVMRFCQDWTGWNRPGRDRRASEYVEAAKDIRQKNPRIGLAREEAI